MFSPHYARARRAGGADPEDHCALNVVLRDPRGDRWTMTERPRAEVARASTALQIGPSRLAWDRGVLDIAIDERGCPVPHRVRGRVRFTPQALPGVGFDLTAGGTHRWSPIAPSGLVELELGEPQIRWRGHGYLDCNFGQRPLERDFRGWNWSRSQLNDGAAVVYDVERSDGEALSLALAFDEHGRVREFQPPPLLALPSSRWGIARTARSATSAGAGLTRTLLDAPFYARSLLRTRLLDQDCVTMHEALDLARFRNPAVQWMLNYRVPRPSSSVFRFSRLLRRS